MHSKQSFSVRSEILGLLVNTLTADYEYSRSNTDNLPLPVQMQLPEKKETFSPSFIPFLESSLNVQQFGKKDEFHGPSIPEVIHSERRVCLHT